jgi:hypothetical protein
MTDGHAADGDLILTRLDELVQGGVIESAERVGPGRWRVTASGWTGNLESLREAHAFIDGTDVMLGAAARLGQDGDLLTWVYWAARARWGLREARTPGGSGSDR